MRKPSPLLYRIGSISRLTERLLGRALHFTGLSPVEFAVLSALEVDGDTTPGALADSLATRASTLTGLLDRLESRGLVERLANPADARSTIVRTTKAGSAAHQAAAPPFREILDPVLEHLGEDLALVEWALGRIERALRAVEGVPSPPNGTRPEAAVIHYPGPALATEDADQVRTLIAFLKWSRQRNLRLPGRDRGSAPAEFGSKGG
jgi:DNA-binding MarR family transcriptional regulator